MGCEVAASVLLSWPIKVELKDEDGRTPLHLATITGNSRIIRNLLLKGAERSILDKRNKTAMIIAVENNYANIIEMLKKPGVFAECKVKPPLRPPKPNYLSVSTFTLFFGGGSILTILFSVQYVHYAASILYGFQIAFTLSLYLLVVNLDPGQLKPDPDITLVDLYEKYESHLICPDCNIFRPARSRHCQNCDRCIEKYDHHCPWVNNCIGARNLGVFFAFLNSIWVSIAFSFVVSIIVVISDHKDNGLYTIPQVTDRVIAGLLGLLSLLFLFPVSCLVYVQYKNFINNRTTNERFSKHGQIKNEHKISTLSFMEVEQGPWDNF